MLYFVSTATYLSLIPTTTGISAGKISISLVLPIRVLTNSVLLELSKARKAVTGAKRKLGTSRTLKARLQDQIEDLSNRDSLTSAEHEQLAQYQAQLITKSKEVEEREAELTSASEECSKLEAEQGVEPRNVSHSVTQSRRIANVHSSSHSDDTQLSEKILSRGDIAMESPTERGEGSSAQKRKGDDLPQAQSKRVRFAVAKSELRSSQRIKKPQREVLVRKTAVPSAVTGLGDPAVPTQGDGANDMNTTEDGNVSGTTSPRIVRSPAAEVSPKTNGNASIGATHDDTAATLPTNARFNEPVQDQLASQPQIQSSPAFPSTELRVTGEQTIPFVDLVPSLLNSALHGPTNSISVIAMEGPVNSLIPNSASMANHLSDPSTIPTSDSTPDDCQETFTAKSCVPIASPMPGIVPSADDNTVWEGTFNERDPTLTDSVTTTETGMGYSSTPPDLGSFDGLGHKTDPALSLSAIREMSSTKTSLETHSTFTAHDDSGLVAGISSSSPSGVESSSTPNAVIHYPPQKIGPDSSTSPGTITSPPTGAAVNPMPFMTALGAQVWPEGVPGSVPAYSTSFSLFDDCLKGSSNPDNTRPFTTIPVFDVNRIVGQMNQSMDFRASVPFNSLAADSFQPMHFDIAGNACIPSEHLTAAPKSSMFGSNSSSMNNALDFLPTSESHSPWTSNSGAHSGSDMAGIASMEWDNFFPLQPGNAGPSGDNGGNKPQSEEQKYPRDAHYVIPQNWNMNLTPVTKPLCDVLCDLLSGDSTDIYTANIRNSRSWNGVSYRALMEYLMRPRQPKATEAGIEMTGRVQTAVDYWSAAWDIQFSKAAMAKAGRSKKHNKNGKKKANNKVQTSKQKVNEDEDIGAEMKSPGWFKRKPGETTAQHNTRMENEANRVVPIFIDNPYNFDKQLLPFPLRTWIRKDARFGRLLGVTCMELALLVLTSEKGYLKCTYHHYSGKDFTGNDIIHRERELRAIEARKAAEEAARKAKEAAVAAQAAAKKAAEEARVAIRRAKKLFAEAKKGNKKRKSAKSTSASDELEVDVPDPKEILGAGDSGPSADTTTPAAMPSAPETCTEVPTATTPEAMPSTPGTYTGEATGLSSTGKAVARDVVSGSEGVVDIGNVDSEIQKVPEEGPGSKEKSARAEKIAAKMALLKKKEKKTSKEVHYLVTGTPELAMQGGDESTDEEKSESESSEDDSDDDEDEEDDDDGEEDAFASAKPLSGYGHCGCTSERIAGSLLTWKGQTIYSPTLDIEETWTKTRPQPRWREFIIDAYERYGGMRVTELYTHVLEKAGDRTWQYVEVDPETILTRCIEHMISVREHLRVTREQSGQNEGETQQRKEQKMEDWVANGMQGDVDLS
ncbi:hypothetical protein VNI00_012432 [Paramarasmius palmivorus]|uniref:Uncharacterized protein n=1 Tax=Paramarasmius palmivorus TaxID=297713 RepID=A0AAW0C714_9AGAR